MDKPIPASIDTRKELEVYFLQYALEAHGFSPKGLDGIMGSNTESAFKEAYRAHRSTEQESKQIPKHLGYAQEYVGINEVAGIGSNPTILGWIKKWFPWAKDDGEIAWCAIFVNEMLKLAGVKGTGKANAKSFLNWGTNVDDNPQKGDIVVFDRGKKGSWQGHVGLFVGLAGNGYIYVLGGNQSNGANIKKYSTNRLRGYRRA